MNREWKIFLTLLFIFWTLIQPPAGLVEARYMRLIKAMVHDGTFVIDNQVDTTQPVGDSAFYNGHYYMGAAPGPSFLGLPFYLIYNAIDPHIPDSFLGEVPDRSSVLAALFVTAATVCVISALAGVMLFRLLGFFIEDEKLRLALTLFFALGTQAFFYSVRLDAYMVSVFLGLACFTLVMMTLRGKSGGAVPFLAGLSAGAIPCMNYDTAMISVVLTLTLLVAAPAGRIKTMAFFALGAVLPLAGLFAYHYACFENPFLPSYYYGQEVGVRETTPMTLAFFTNPENLPPLDRLWGITFGRRGFFVYAPIMLLSLVGMLMAVRHRMSGQLSKEWRTPLLVAGILCLLYFLFQATTPLWLGYSTWGPRYMVPGIPFFFLFVAYAALHIRRFWIYTLGGVSVGISWVGAQFGYCDSLFYHIAQFVISGPTTPVHRWLASVVPAYVIPHHAETITPGAAMHYALTHLSALGVYLILAAGIYVIWNADRWWRKEKA